MTIAKTLLAISVLLAVAVAATVLGNRLHRQPPNVVWITVDALRPDHLGAYGYHRDLSPHIDRLAAQGTRFTNAISQGTWTLPSVTSLFLSQYVSSHGVEALDRRIPDEAQTLAEVLREHGYATAAFVMGAYTTRDFGMDQGFDHFVAEPVDGERRTEWIREWIDGRDRAKPFFLYAHFVDVHYPYRRQNPYRENYGLEYRGFVDGIQPVEPIKAKLGREDVQHLIDLYDNDVAYIDFHLGRLFSWLHDVSLDDNTIVILTADHGEAFQEHRQMLGHRGCPYEELIHVPLLMRGPGVATGRVITTPVEHIDLAPTILDLCDIEPCPAMQGRSVRHLFEHGDAHKPSTFSEFLPYELKAIRTGEWKLIADYKTGQHQLFDLHTDAAELRNLADERPEVVQRLLSELSSFSTANLAWRRKPSGAAVEQGRETLEQLRALGYVEE